MPLLHTSNQHRPELVPRAARARAGGVSSGIHFLHASLSSAKCYESHELTSLESSLVRNDFRPWFEELKERVPVQ